MYILPNLLKVTATVKFVGTHFFPFFCERPVPSEESAGTVPPLHQRGVGSDVTEGK